MTSGEGNRSERTPLPAIGTEVWGRQRPSAKVPDAEWIKIGFGEDPYHPQLHTGWRLVEISTYEADTRSPSLVPDKGKTSPNIYGVDAVAMRKKFEQAGEPDKGSELKRKSRG